MTLLFLWRDATACCLLLLSGESTSKILQAHRGQRDGTCTQAGDPGLK